MTTSRDTEPSAADGLWVGVFLALLAGVLLFNTSSTDLGRFPDRAIGAALLSGVDPSRRYGLYLRIVAIPIGLMLGAHYLTRRWRQLTPHWFVGLQARVERDTINTLCAVGILSLVAVVAADHLEAWTPAVGLLAAILLV